MSIKRIQWNDPLSQSKDREYHGKKKFFNSYKNETKAGVTSLGWYSTENSTKYLMGLFNNQKIFDHPKPRDLIRYIIEQTLGKEDIILDFFSGSATVADALYSYNLMGQLKCQYILVQLPEDIQKKSLPLKRVTRLFLKSAENEFVE